MMNWVDTILDQFYPAFQYYKTHVSVKASGNSIPATNFNDAQKPSVTENNIEYPSNIFCSI